MPAAQTALRISTAGPGAYEITGQLARFLSGQDADIGLLTVFVRHTSCSLLIQENADPDVQTDLQAWLERLVPPADHPSHAYFRHVLEGPDDMPAHIKAALLPVSLGIPVADGRMALGTWQGVFLIEHRQRPHQREVVAHLSR
jgi:secondary thiamine-phosphate synthase enzyme